ncbi:hypothetical protein ACET3Z_015639 [Daucus carota]
MDKTPDVRRAKPSRSSSNVTAQSGSDFKKLRKDKVRRLSFVDRLCDKTPDSEMPCVQSDDEEDEYHPCVTKSKRIKLPRKFFDDCQKVDHSSVPRKLRSAIRKRRRESISPHFPEVRRLNLSANGIELQPKESEGSPGLASVMPVSKDEEEVAETLNALAEMFSDSDKIEMAKSTAPEVEKDLWSPFTTTAPGAAQHSSNTVGSSDEAERIQFSYRRTEADMHRYIPKFNCTKVPILSKSSSANENCSSFPSHSQLSREIGLKRPAHNLNMANEIYKELADESVLTFKGQNEVRLGTRENRNNGSALWPGLSSTSVHSAKTLGSPVKLSAAKVPTWLGISTSTARSCSSRNVAISEKEFQSVVDEKKMRKKCSTHVYISRLIRVLKVTEAKDSLPLQPTRLTAHDESKKGAISEEKKLQMIKEGSAGVVFTSDIACSGGEDSPSKLSSAIVLHKRLRDDLQGSTNSGPYTTHKQSSNFFAALPGSSGVEHESAGQVNGHRPEPSTESNIPFLYPFTQSCRTNPLSLPQNCQLSTSLVDSAAAGAAPKIQLPPYLSNTKSVTSSLTSLQNQQQHQQWLWAAQLTAPRKPEEFAAAASHVPNWQNSRQEFSHMQYGQLIHPAALEVLGPRYIPVPTQQQHLMSSTSLFPQSRGQRYNHQLSTKHG